jgi:hypothetical protein
MATLNGCIQPPPPTWDPYAPPGAAPGLFAEQPYFSAPGQFVMPPVVAQAQRFLRDVALDYHWFPRNGTGGLGINDADLSASFSFPLLYNVQTPLVVTPGFAFHLWDGPASTGPVSQQADMPPATYDAYLDAEWDPQISPVFGAELNARVGIYSDFRLWDNEAFRFTGKGMAVMTVSPAVKIKAGIWYLDRVRVKLLPAGGIVWTPNADTRFDVLFPNPKFTQRLTTVGTTEWWWYLSGEYGGGTWVVYREKGADPGVDDLVSYNDIRLALGIEFKRCNTLGGLFEVGYAFNRELVYSHLDPSTFQAGNSVFLRAGLTF